MLKVLSFLLLASISLFGQEDNYTFNIPGTGANIQMTYIPSGEAILGGEDGALVHMSSFWMSATEITYDQFQPFRDPAFDKDTSTFKPDYKVDAITRPTVPYLDFTYGMGSKGGFPAVSMTQQAALRYCQWLYEKTGVFYRLPTEAEWEYACLGGDDGSNGDPDNYFWNADNSDDKYQLTGQKEPNGFGLYDMLGNVSEYTSEQYSENYYQTLEGKTPHTIQFTPSGKYGRSVRGGAYDDVLEDCTCASRIPSNPAWQARDPQIPKSLWWNPDSPFVGFRIVRPQATYTPEQIQAYFEKAIVD